MKILVFAELFSDNRFRIEKAFRMNTCFNLSPYHHIFLRVATMCVVGDSLKLLVTKNCFQEPMCSALCLQELDAAFGESPTPSPPVGLSGTRS